MKRRNRRLAEIDHAARGRRLADLFDALDGSGDKWGVIASLSVPAANEATE